MRQHDKIVLSAHCQIGLWPGMLLETKKAAHGEDMALCRQVFSLSQKGELRREEGCLDSVETSNKVKLMPCHGTWGNQEWVYNLVSNSCISNIFEHGTKSSSPFSFHLCLSLQTHLTPQLMPSLSTRGRPSHFTQHITPNLFIRGRHSHLTQQMVFLTE